MCHTPRGGVLCGIMILKGLHCVFTDFTRSRPPLTPPNPPPPCLFFLCGALTHTLVCLLSSVRLLLIEDDATVTVQLSLGVELYFMNEILHWTEEEEQDMLWLQSQEV